jgi:enamine deaminase RidA (YjgF/YER057c/UK114 family)
MAKDVNVAVVERFGRRTASTGAPWEPIVGYSRAVRSGNLIAVSGTVGRGADGAYSPSLGEQTRRALAIVQAAIEALGGRLEYVIRTRMFVTDIARWEEAARAHGEAFGAIRPATTMVEVAKLIDAEALVEVEADAVVPDAG